MSVTTNPSITGVPALGAVSGGSGSVSITGNTTVASVSALKNIPKTFASLLSPITVTSYYGDKNGGGGTYLYDPTSTGSDNGGTIIVGNDGAYWNLINEGSVSVAQFGARKWTSGTPNDSTTAFQNAYLWAASSARTITGLSDPRGTVRITIPAGTFLISSAEGMMTTTSPGAKLYGIQWEGAGSSVTSILYSPSSSGYLCHNNRFIRPGWKGIEFVCTDAASSFLFSEELGAVTNIQDSRFEDITWRGSWTDLIYVTGGNNNSEWKFDKCFVADTLSGSWVNAPASGSDQQLNYWFHHCKFWPTGGTPKWITMAKGGHIKIDQCDVSGWQPTLPTAYASGTCGATSNTTTTINITGTTPTIGDFVTKTGGNTGAVVTAGSTTSFTIGTGLGFQYGDILFITARDANPHTITSYNSTTGVVAVTPAFSAAPQAADTYTATEIRQIQSVLTTGIATVISPFGVAPSGTSTYSVSSPVPLFYLTGTIHANGVCSFRCTGLRIEYKSDYGIFSYTNWPQGIFSITDLDESSQYSAVPPRPANLLRAVFDATTTTRGPAIRWQQCVLLGRHCYVRFNNNFRFTQSITYDQCTLMNAASGSDFIVANNGVSGNIGGLPVIHFTNNTASLNDFNTSTYQICLDTDLYWAQSMGGSASTKRVSLVGPQGNLPATGNPTKIKLPINTYVVGITAYKSTGGTSANSTITVQTGNATPVTLGTFAITTGTAAGSIYDTGRINIPLLTDADSILTISGTGVSLAGYNLILEYLG